MDILADNENYEPGGGVAASRLWSCFLDEWQGVATLAVPVYCAALALYALICIGTTAGLPVAIVAGAWLTYTIRRLLTVVTAPASPHEIAEAIWRRVAA